MMTSQILTVSMWAQALGDATWLLTLLVLAVMAAVRGRRWVAAWLLLLSVLQLGDSAWSLYVSLTGFLNAQDTHLDVALVVRGASSLVSTAAYTVVLFLLFPRRRVG